MSTSLNTDSGRNNILSSENLTVDLGRRTARGGAIASVAQIARILVSLAIAALMARLLAPKDFGLVAMATAVTGFVGLFTDLGLSAATVQQKEIDQATITALFYINLVMGVALTVACLAAAPLAAWFFGDRRLLLLTVAMGLSIPVSAAGAQHGALLQRGMRWTEMQWTPILAQLSGGIAGVLFAWKGGIGYWALAIQAWVGAAISTALLWHFSRWRPDFTLHWRQARSALHFGLNLAGFSFVNYFHRQFDNALVGWRWGSTSLGYYSIAYSLLTLPLTLISSPMASSVIPALSRLQHEPERWNRAFLRAFNALNLISAGLTTILIVSAYPLVRIVYGTQWHESGKIFALLAISMFAATPVNATGWIYISLGQSARMLRWSMIVTPFYITAFLVGLPFGPRGVALCYSIVMCVASVPYLAYATAKSPSTFWSVLKISAPPTLVGASIIFSEALFHWMPINTNAFIEITEDSLCAGGTYVVAILSYSVCVTSIKSVKNNLCSLWKGVAAYIR